MGESPINLGRLIKNARLEAGLTQDNLATQVGVTPRYIMAIENENKYPSIQVLSKIICTLKITADTGLATLFHTKFMRILSPYID